MKLIKAYFSFFVIIILIISSSKSFGQYVETDQNCIQDSYNFEVSNRTLKDFIDIKNGKAVLSDVNAGEIPEGDNINDVCFSQDGNKIFIAHGFTNNVTVIDWETMTLIKTIDVGIYPFDIATTNDYAIIACIFSNEVYIINVNSLDIDTVFHTNEQPAVIKVSNDFNFAYIACDINDVCEVIDLFALSHTYSINNFPIALYGYSGTYMNNRKNFRFTNLQISQDNNHLIVPGWSSNVFFINTHNGQVDYEIENIQNCRILELSGNGNILVCLGYDISIFSHLAYQVDVQTHSVIDSIIINNNYNGLGVDHKGTKAFVSLSTNASALINFSTSASTIFGQTKSPRWIKNSSDNNYVIAGNDPISIISYETESIISQYTGQPQQKGAVSPVLSKIAAIDNHISEMVYCYDYTNPIIITLYGSGSTGKYPEGDAPHRVEFIHTGEKAVFLNSMSQNIGILDIRTSTIDALIDVGANSCDLKVTSDSKWAVTLESSENLVHIIDLENLNVASVLPVGDFPLTVSISPNDSFAYVGNIASNTITVVELDGSQSTILTEINIGDIGWISTRKGYGSDVCPNPSGDYILVAASFSDMVQVVDTDSWSVVSNLPVGDFPMIIEYIDNSSYAVVLNYFDNTYSLLYINGSLSSVVNTFSTGGQFPFDVEYNSSTNELSIINHDSKNLVRLNPFTGIVSSVQDLSGYGSPVQLRLDNNGHPIILTNNSNYLIANDSVYPLIGSASFLNYSSEANIGAVTIPGPDAISIVEFEAFNISVRAFLEGPFVSTEMVANLNENNLPLNQPFNCNPWNYNGNEHVSVIPNAEIVDWVMLEIRETDGDSSTATSDKIVDRKAGFILKNGNIVSANGYDLIKFKEEINNSLYVIVWQRNHLPIMSANPLFQNKNTYQYDFTSNPDNVFGGIYAIKELDTDYWGMISGDANADGLIDIQDIINNWYDHAGKSGYYNSDFNLDNQIDNKDKNSFWLPNEGYSSVIPE